jgi:hypothetical protein
MNAYLKNFILIAVLATPASAFAQGRVPHTDSAAVGGEVGVFLPRDGAYDAGPALEGFYEYYMSARNSLRLGVGWANPKWAPEHSDSLRHVRVAADLVHNWEGGAVHPFVGAGLGIYFLQFKDNGHSVGDSETKLGGTLFGGAEFFASPTTSVKAEVKYHAIQNVGLTNPDGLSLSIGLKKYF